MRADGPPQPTLDASLAWLRANAFAPRRIALCWGDSRLPNLMFRDDRVVAVLDWEMAFLGDPEADLGWWCFLDWANNEGYGGPHLDGIPGKEETLARYAEITGHPVEHAHWHEVFAAFRYGVILARVAIRMRAIGASLPAPDWESNNVCTQALARLLDLPPPGEERLTTSVGRREPDAPVRLQFRLSGTGGGDWYVLVRGDDAARATRASSTIRMRRSRPTSADWRAVQAGDLDRLQAFMDGKLRISGDLTLFMLHEDAHHPAQSGGREHGEHDAHGDARGRSPAPPGSERAAAVERELLVSALRSGARDRRRAARRACTCSAATRTSTSSSPTRARSSTPSTEHRAPRRRRSTGDTFTVAGLRVDIEQPLERFRLRYDARPDRLRPALGGVEPGLQVPHPAERRVPGPHRAGRARDGHGHARRRRRSRSTASGHRDHSWGGERDWAKFHRWTYLSGEFGTDFWFNAVRIDLGEQLDIRIGCLWDGHELLALQQLEIEPRTVEGGSRQIGRRCAHLTDEHGREHHIVGEEVVANCPVWMGRTVLKDGITRYRMRRSHRLGHPRARLHRARRADAPSSFP